MIYPFSSHLYKDENEVVNDLLQTLDWSGDMAASVHGQAVNLVEATRAQKGRGGQLEAFLQEFSLNTEEGLAMMCLAEALLRIPDAKTANMLIKDKVAAANWLQKQGDGPKDWVTKAAGVGMALTRKALDSSLSKLGEPVIREAMLRAMQMMGKQFVLGTDIADALAHARQWERQGYRMSYDMLGEGARERTAAATYFESYLAAIAAISAKNSRSNDVKAGISVKLSALHPRYTYTQRAQCIPEITEMLRQLCMAAKKADMPLTVDAEEAARLDISVSIIENILRDPDLAGWDGFGLAVQAYQKRCLPLIDYIASIAREQGRKIQMRLVKGAYWDTEVKLAQIGGMPEYPVFTRKCNTDLSYLTCAQAMFAHADVVYPMFATHNAHTVAAIRAMARGKVFEFQRLHGMGEGLYVSVIGDDDVKVSVYAPVGPHRDLLPYLVRRLLENGANSSFVNQLLDKSMPAGDIVPDPVAQVRTHENHRHPAIPLPKNIFGEERANSDGIDFNDPCSSRDVVAYVSNNAQLGVPKSIVEGKYFDDIDERFIDRAFRLCADAFPAWCDRDVTHRAGVLNRIADLLERDRDALIRVLVHEAGKTMPDARDEVREAVDFCRYYAAQAEKDFDRRGVLMPGYTGEDNRLTLQGRGVFVCISPWNFPLAIFTGQIVAALMAGNCVVAKPASQTRLIAMMAVKLMHEAGVPENALHLLLGDGRYGGKIVADKRVAGVAFTGSTATAKRIQMTLVQENDAIVPFVAETGGQNAMIVDSSALPEQVIDDVLISAFGSAGQRCSALRVLYLQDDIADNVIELLQGAMAELRVGDPSDLSVDVGYIIDAQAKQVLDAHCEYMQTAGKLISRCDSLGCAADNSRLFAPVAYEIDGMHVLKEEVFGPVLHVVRFKAEDIDRVIMDINATGYGLTFGLHSRILKRQNDIAASVNAGNIYINRTTIGAIVGVQPFGGMGLSGTGPKAGGPHYLHAFATEKVVTTNTTAAGGNTTLITLSE